jgi:hypothetical protein
MAHWTAPSGAGLFIGSRSGAEAWLFDRKFGIAGSPLFGYGGVTP